MFKLWGKRISVEDFMAFFVVCLQFLVERSKVFVRVCQVVAGPLTFERDDECVSKVIPVLNSGGGALVFTTGGRTTLKKRRLFDCTMGYPGEDVLKSGKQLPLF